MVATDPMAVEFLGNVEGFIAVKLDNLEVIEVGAATCECLDIFFDRFIRSFNNYCYYSRFNHVNSDVWPGVVLFSDCGGGRGDYSCAVLWSFFLTDIYSNHLVNSFGVIRSSIVFTDGVLYPCLVWVLDCLVIPFD